MSEKIVAIILVYLSKQTLSQYDGSYGVQQGFQYSPYQNIPYQYQDQILQNNKWNEEENVNYKDYKDYNEYDENICDCTKCSDLKPSCLNSCPNCISTPQPILPQNYFILPFPYPYPMKETAASVHKETPRTTTATVTTTTSTTTTTTEATTIKETTGTITEATTEFFLETAMTMSPFHVVSKRPYLITSLRKTKPNWMPNYGIVPISDTFAEKIMLQLRDMKVLHPRKDVARNGGTSPLQ